MNPKRQAADERMAGRIDALVCGELPEDERRELVSWLEADASRWRACGLAFLEAQVWAEALETEGSGFRVQGSGERGQRSEVGSQKALVVGTVHRAGGRSWLAPLIVLAASIAAFMCGLGFQQWRQGSRESEPPIARPDLPLDQSPLATGPLVASVPVTGGPLGNISATIQFPVLPVEASAGQAASSVPDHVRRQWERRGYELVEQRRYLPARLPDGKQVMVPVNEVKMKFVGKPVS
jgi:hypothetical protein